MRQPPKNFRVTVEHTSICTYQEFEPAAVNEAGQLAKLTKHEVTVVQLRPDYRVVAIIEAKE